jgi:sugar phosphate isomerase/epimerase
MKLTRREMLAACAAAAIPTLSALAAEPEKRTGMGVVIHSYGIRSAESRRRNDKPMFGDPLVFLDHCRQLGAGGIQVGVGARDREYTAKLRKHAEDAGMYLEGSVGLPKDRADVERFAAEVQSAKDAGAKVLRTAVLSGRRYETFDTAESFEKFSRQAYESLGLAEPVVAKADLRLAVENHKDWRVGELLDLLKRLGSRGVGVCVDTGNSIALLEEPLAVVEAYAPLAFTTHIKDMTVAEYEEGFLLAEVPLGTGFLDLKKIVGVLREKQPDVRLNLEMITRDPLKVPCLTRKYWATMEALPARELAEALARVRKHSARDIPRVSGLSQDKQVAAEEDNVRRCLSSAREQLGI